MPAIPYIAAAMSVAGGINDINNSNSQNAALGNQLALEMQKFGWTKEQTQEALKRQIEASNNYWKDPANNPSMTYDQATNMASNELNSLYNDQAQNAIKDASRGLMARGFYGQLPGDSQTLDALAKVENARASAVGGRASQLYDNSQSRALAYKQLGMNTFGTYGTMDVPVFPTVETGQTGGSGSQGGLPGVTNPNYDPNKHNYGYGYGGVGQSGNNGSNGPSVSFSGGSA